MVRCRAPNDVIVIIPLPDFVNGSIFPHPFSNTDLESTNNRSDCFRWRSEFLMQSGRKIFRPDCIKNSDLHLKQSDRLFVDSRSVLLNGCGKILPFTKSGNGIITITSFGARHRTIEFVSILLIIRRIGMKTSRGE